MRHACAAIIDKPSAKLSLYLLFLGLAVSLPESAANMSTDVSFVSFFFFSPFIKFPQPERLKEQKLLGFNFRNRKWHLGLPSRLFPSISFLAESLSTRWDGTESTDLSLFFSSDFLLLGLTKLELLSDSAQDEHFQIVLGSDAVLAEKGYQTLASFSSTF